MNAQALFLRGWESRHRSSTNTARPQTCHPCWDSPPPTLLAETLDDTYDSGTIALTWTAGGGK